MVSLQQPEEFPKDTTNIREEVLDGGVLQGYKDLPQRAEIEVQDMDISSLAIHWNDML